MKAVQYNRYGSAEVLKLTAIKKPVPKEDEVLVKMQATAVSSGDVHLRSADPFPVRFFFGLFKPKKKVLGFAVAGEVEAVGTAVKRFKKGDAVFGTTGMRFGAYAEYVCLPEDGVLARKPTGLTWEEAAAIPFGANTALYFLRKANIKMGQKVLIYGASGAVGTAAVQIARYFGGHVTGVCSTANLQLVRALGAGHVIDYTREHFAVKGQRYDVIFDTVGKSSFSSCIRSLTKNGVLLLSAAGPKQMIDGLWVSLTTRKKVVSGVVSETAKDMAFIKELIEVDKLKAVIDRSYPLAQIAEAHRYVEGGHKKGNVVIAVAGITGE